MEGTDPHAAGRGIDHGLDARPHFTGGLVGEGHGQHRVRRQALDIDQPGDAVHQHPRLAAAGSGKYQQRVLRCTHGLSLCIIQ